MAAFDTTVKCDCTENNNQGITMVSNIIKVFFIDIKIADGKYETSAIINPRNPLVANVYASFLYCLKS